MILIDENMLPYRPITFTENGIQHYEMAVTMADVSRIPKIDAEMRRGTKFVPVHDNCVMCLACGAMLNEGASVDWNRCPMCGAIIVR